MHTSFPYKNSLSYILMPLKVYPPLKRLNNKVKEHVVPGKNFYLAGENGCLEIYDCYTTK